MANNRSLVEGEVNKLLDRLSLTALPPEVVLYVLSFLTHGDQFRFGQTSTKFSDMTQSNFKSFLLFPEPEDLGPLEYLNEDVSILEDVLDKKDEGDHYRVFETVNELRSYQATHNCRGFPIVVEVNLPKERIMSELKKHHSLFIAGYVKKINNHEAEFDNQRFRFKE